MFQNRVFLRNSLYSLMFGDITPGLSLDGISSITFLLSEPCDLIPVSVFFSYSISLFLSWAAFRQTIQRYYFPLISGASLLRY